MKNIIIAQRNKDLQVMSYGEGFECGESNYRVITKCQAGFMVSSVVKAKSPIHAFRQYKPKAIQSIAFIKRMKDGSEHDFPVFARAGKKIWASEEFLREVEVGDINQALSNTALYSQIQYSAVNASSWASKAYVMNEEESK
jgi:hypothetical protein